MTMNAINSVTSTFNSYQTSQASKKVSETADKTTTTDKTETGVVYEKSSQTDKNTVTKKTDYKMVEKLKADAKQRTSQLRSLVEKMMTKQGTAIANADSMWSFLAEGNFTVDEETQKQAQADIAEDGYWGVEQTSDRILDFAKALSGNDPEKADLLIDAFKKGFDDATKSWGKDLPDISKRTYDAVLEKFDKWKNGSTTETAGTETEN